MFPLSVPGNRQVSFPLALVPRSMTKADLCGASGKLYFPSVKYLEACFVADIGSGRSPSAHWCIYRVGARRSPATLKYLGACPGDALYFVGADGQVVDPYLTGIRRNSFKANSASGSECSNRKTALGVSETISILPNLRLRKRSIPRE